MLKIWGRTTSSNVQKVLWTCAELNIEYDRVDHGGPFGGDIGLNLLHAGIVEHAELAHPRFEQHDGIALA